MLDDIARLYPQNNALLPAKAVTQRLRRAAHHVDTEVRRHLAPHDMELWEFELLTALRRSEPDHRLTMGELADIAQLTSGAITNRVTRMEGKGLMRREIAAADRRQIVVTLTAEGLARSEEVIAVMQTAQAAIYAPVDLALQERLADALRELLLVLEGPSPTPGPA